MILQYDDYNQLAEAGQQIIALVQAGCKSRRNTANAGKWPCLTPILTQLCPQNSNLNWPHLTSILTRLWPHDLTSRLNLKILTSYDLIDLIGSQDLTSRFWPQEFDLNSTPCDRIFLAQSLYLEGADPLDPSMDYVIDDDGYGDVIDPASDAFSLDLEAYELSQAGYNVDPEYDFLEW